MSIKRRGFLASAGAVLMFPFHKLMTTKDDSIIHPVTTYKYLSLKEKKQKLLDEGLAPCHKMYKVTADVYDGRNYPDDTPSECSIWVCQDVVSLDRLRKGDFVVFEYETSDNTIRSIVEVTTDPYMVEGMGLCVRSRIKPVGHIHEDYLV
jgi:hypothetical protein